MPRPKKDSKQLFAYKPDPKKYESKSDAYVLGKVLQVKELAKGVQDIAEQAKENAAETTDSIEHLLNVFTSRHNLNFPEDKRYVGFDAKSGKPADIIFRVMGMLLADIRTQYISPPGADEGKRDEIEKHLNALPPWFYRKFRQRYDIQSLFWQLLAGRSYVQQSYLPFYWDKEIRSRRDDETDGAFNARVAGYKAYAGPPFFRESIDPRVCFQIPGPMGPEAHVKIYKVQRFELQAAMARVGKRITFRRNGDLDSIEDLKKPAGLEVAIGSDEPNTSAHTYYEYIDESYCYYVVDNKVVHRYNHEGGIKVFDAYALQTGMKEQAFMSVGILWAVRNELPQFDFLRTLWMQKAYLDVFPQLMAQLSDEDSPLQDEKGNPVEWKIEPGTIKQMRGQLVNALSDAATSMDFKAAVEMLAGDIDLATIPALARGIAGAQQPGYSINQLTQSMRTLWKPIIESRELQQSMMDEHYLWTGKHIVDEPMTVFAELENPETGRFTGDYITLDPADDIDEYFQVRAHLDPELPIDMQGQLLTGANLKERGHITEEEFTREFAKKTNPVERQRQIWRDQGRRAMFSKAVEDAMALGRVKLTNDIIEARGLDRLNAIGSLDIQALKETRARAEQAAAAVAQGGEGGGTEVPTSTPPGDANATGPGINPTTGANPNDPTPGPRIGSGT